MANAVNIYIERRTPRHEFTFKLIFNELLGIEYFTTSDPSDKSIHVNYSEDTQVSGIQIEPIGLLAEQAISNHWQSQVKISRWNDLDTFFKTSDGILPFDLFSAVFYCVSRYEEYLDFTADVHDRFTASQSFLLKGAILHKPLVNQWVLALKQLLCTKYSELHFVPRKFEYISTIDVDQAWKFKHKGFIRNVLGSFRDLKERKWENFKDRWPTVLGLKPDSFYNFDWQHAIHHRYSIEVKYFILLGDLTKYDKNISYKNTAFQALIRDLVKYAEVGIHPSYKSNTSSQLVREEIKRLSDVLQAKITLSRQHFLMHKMPHTYQELLANGISEDHTLGYSTHLGFRAGIAAPFFFFDLSKNETTSLRLYPFCAMDITPLHYMNQSPDEAIQALSELMDDVKKVGGLFVSLWHNESFSETERWKGWLKVYEHLLAYSSKD